MLDSIGKLLFTIHFLFESDNCLVNLGRDVWLIDAYLQGTASIAPVIRREAGKENNLLPFAFCLKAISAPRV